MDLADLAMRFRAEGARQSSRDMDAVTASADRAGRQANQLAARSDNLGAAFARLRAAAVPLASALTAAFGIRAMAQAADAWSTMSWRMQNVTGDAQSAAAALSRLSDVADQTWTTIDQTADAFLRQETTMSALGYTIQEQIDHIEALNSALLISGLRGQRAEQVAAAWSRAMARGTLRGEEFNSVAENAPRLMQALAEAMNVSVIELRALAEEGRLTGDVMFLITQALQEMRGELEGDATLSGSVIRLDNAFTRLIGTLDSSTAVTATLGSAVIMLADNMDLVASVAGGVAVAGVLALTSAINLATIATRAWSAALAITPLGALAIAVGAATTALLYFRDETVEVMGVSVRMGNVLHAVWTTISEPIAAAVRWVGLFLSAMVKLASLDFSGSLADVQEALSMQAWEDAGNSIIEAWSNLSAEGENVATINDAVAAAIARSGGASEEAAKAAKKFREEFEALEAQLYPHLHAMHEYREAQEMIDRAIEAGLVSREVAADMNERLWASYRDAINPLEAVWRGLEEERALIAMTAQERAVHTEMQRLENELRQAGIILSQQERAEMEEYIRGTQRQDEASKSFNASVQELGRNIDTSFSRMTDALKRGEDAWESLGRMALDVLEEIVMSLLQANDAFGGGGQSFGAAIAQGIASLFHSGGIVGQPTATRMVSPLAFAGAPRMHSGGIAGDEVPAILRRGEEVLPENHPRHRNNAGGMDVNVSLKVINNAGVEVSAGRAQSDGQGGVSLEVMLDEAVGRQIGRFGSQSNKAIRAGFGVKPMTARR